MGTVIQWHSLSQHRQCCLAQTDARMCCWCIWLKPGIFRPALTWSPHSTGNPQISSSETVSWCKRYNKEHLSCDWRLNIPKGRRFFSTLQTWVSVVLQCQSHTLNSSSNFHVEGLGVLGRAATIVKHQCRKPRIYIVKLAFRVQNVSEKFSLSEKWTQQECGRLVSSLSSPRVFRLNIIIRHSPHTELLTIMPDTWADRF